MSTAVAAPGGAEVKDLYALDPKDARLAPTTLRERWKFLGPGMIMSAAVIGA